MIKLMGIREYAETRNVSDKLIRKLIDQKKLFAGKVGNKWLLNVERCDKFFEELTTPPEPKVVQGTAKFDAMAMLDAMEKRCLDRAKGGRNYA